MTVRTRHPRARRPAAPLAAIAVLAALALAAAPELAAQEPPLASPRLTEALVRTISGEKAWAYTEMISRFDRIQASQGWHDAAVAIRDELKRLGWSDVVLEGWPSDGTRRYATYRSVIGWRAKSAELWMTSPVRERLCSYDEVPLTLVKHSGSGHVEAGLVDVGSGVGEAAYAGRDVKGKIVLATGNTAQVMAEAVRDRGALGVLTYYPPDVRPGYPAMIRYTALWPRWEDRETLGFAFNISKNQGATLKRLLEEGQTVTLRADVETEFMKTKLEVLSAAIRGAREPDKEIMIVGHLCHPLPSANDNASGSGGMLEMARALREMIDRGLVDPPARTIRFLWVPEFNGVLPYVAAHLERTRNTLAVVNCDMIGEDLHKTGGVLNIFTTPHSVPSYLNDVACNFAALAERLDLRSLKGSSHPFVWRRRAYSGGSDHVVFNDGALRAPAVMLNRDDVFHHTNLDDMDKVDATELRRASFVALGTALYIASAGDTEALDTARLVARNALGRAAADYYDAAALMRSAADATKLHAAREHTFNVIAHAVRRESDAVRSAGVLARGKGTAREIEKLTGHLETAGREFPREAGEIYEGLRGTMNTAPEPRTAAMNGAEADAATRRVPVRAKWFVGPLDGSYLADKLGEEAARGRGLSGDAAYEALNFVDGRRSIHDIALAVSAELGPVGTADIAGFFALLERAGLVTLRPGGD